MKEEKKEVEKKEGELIHLHVPEVRPSFYVLLLLVPSMVFILVLAVFVRGTRNRAAQTENSVVLSKETGKTVVINNTQIIVNLADSEVERRKGLSGVSQLEDGRGVLFVFEQQDVQPPFWMKDMLISIDIVWINDGEIVQIDSEVLPEPGTPDRALKLYIPSVPVDYVLEVAAGFCKRNGIKAGDKVEFNL